MRQISQFTTEGSFDETKTGRPHPHWQKLMHYELITCVTCLIVEITHCLRTTEAFFKVFKISEIPEILPGHNL